MLILRAGTNLTMQACQKLFSAYVSWEKKTIYNTLSWTCFTFPSKIIFQKTTNASKFMLISRLAPWFAPWKGMDCIMCPNKGTTPVFSGSMQLVQVVFHQYCIQFHMQITGEKAKINTWKAIWSPKYICFSYSPKGIWSRIVMPIASKGYPQTKVVIEFTWHLPLGRERVADLPCSMQIIPSSKISLFLLKGILRLLSSVLSWNCRD